MTLSDRINDLFEKFNVSLKVSESDVAKETLAELTLDNGTVIYTDAEAFSVGADAYIINEEGERIPLPDGDYTIEGGSIIGITDGKVSTSPAAPDDTDLEINTNMEKVEMNEEQVLSMLNERFPDLGAEVASAIAAAVAEIYAQPEEEGVAEKDKEEEMYAEDKVQEPVAEAQEMSAEEPAQPDPIAEVMEQLKAVTAELTELKAQAASEGVQRQVATPAKVEPVDMSKLNLNERVEALFNQFNK